MWFLSNNNHIVFSSLDIKLHEFLTAHISHPKGLQIAWVRNLHERNSDHSQANHYYPLPLRVLGKLSILL